MLHLHVCVVYVYMASVFLTIFPICASSTCPLIHIKYALDDESWQCLRGCDPGFYCQDGFCTPCGDCPDPYILAAQGKKEMFVIGECIGQGSCPKTCANTRSSLPKANFSLCDCVGVPPPTPAPTEATSTCREGCMHGNCENPGECNCEVGWKGELCDQCIEDCVNGHCNSTSGLCICLAGWDGTACDQDIDYCANNQPCKNGGTCLNAETGFNCRCSEDFKGAHCEMVKQRSCGGTCQQNETCVETESGVFECRCKEGVTGVKCVKAKDGGPPMWVYIIIVGVVVVIVCFLLAVWFFRNHSISWKSLVPWRLQNDSEATLLPPKLMYELDGDTLVLKDLHNWTSCTLHVCECVPGFPVTITAEMSNFRVPNLVPGLITYHFEIFPQPSDVENGVSVAELEICIPALDEEQHKCTGKLEVLQDISLRRSLNELLDSSADLRKCISNYYHQFKDFQRDLIAKPINGCADNLREILESRDELDSSINPLLSYIAGNKPEGAQKFVRKLMERHSTCKVCLCICHRLHGGTGLQMHENYQEMSIDDNSSSTQV